MYKKASFLFLLVSALSFAQSNVTSVCGNGICESGESPANCCTDCPDTTSSAGSVSGAWYCQDASTMARIVSISSYVCNGQTHHYDWVTANSTESQACPQGQSCSGGRCVSVASCTDSDGGKGYSVAGKSYSSNSSIEGRVDCCKNEYSDFMGDSVAHVGPGGGPCVSEGGYLYEAVCGDDGIPTHVVYKCPGGCANGACTDSTSAVPCADSDGGADIYSRGAVSYGGASYKDYCVPVVSSSGGVTYAQPGVAISFPERVFEYYCGKGGVESSDYECTYGCSEGACKRGAFEISVSTDKSSYSLGDSVQINVGTWSGGMSVNADVKGYVTRPDGGIEDLYFSPIVCPSCPPGAVCAAELCAAPAGGSRASYYPAQPGAYYLTVKAAYNGNAADSSAKFSVAGSSSLDFSVSTDRNSYSLGDEVRISAKASSAGALVDAYVKGVVVRPDGRTDELVFAKEACVRKPCPYGEACAAVEECPVRLGVSSASYRPQAEGGYSIKATASYGDSIAESYAKFTAGVRKKLQMSVWLGDYKFQPGGSVKIFAKLVDSSGVPVSGAEVSARVYWAGKVRPYSTQIVGIEPAAARVLEEKQAGVAAKKEMRVAESRAEAVVPTGYAVAISSSVEKQVASGDSGLTYEEYRRMSTEASATAVAPSSASVAAAPSSMAKLVPPQYLGADVKLEYNPSSGYYEGSYDVPADARSGEYKVGVFAYYGGQQLHGSASFSVGGEDYVSFEGRARQAASEGKYGDCKDYFLKAAQKLSEADQRRMFLDIEKAGICARLGNLPNSFYSEVGRIVENSASGGSEKYVLLGIASQYYGLGGDYRRSRELLEKAAAGLEAVQGELEGAISSGRGASLMGGDPTLGYSMLSDLILAKYYSLLGNDAKAAGHYRLAAGVLAGRQGSGSDAFLYGLFAARLYAKAGDTGSSKAQYLIAANLLSDKPTGASDALASAFLAGDAYEKAGEQDKAKAQYQKVVGMPEAGSYGAGDSFFTYGALGKSYERLGEKEKAKDAYTKGLERLLLKQDSESSYFAAGLSGYLGDYGQAKELCRKHFELSLSEDGNIGKLTFMNAYCYSVLGDSVRAKKGCDLNSISPQGETMVLEYLLEPLPPPVSYCSQSSDVATSSCGNGAVDAGETSENCCVDTGCAFGDACSKALGKCVKPVGEIPPEKILDVLLKLEDARMKLDALELKARSISKYYSGTDKARSDAWDKAASIFGDAKGTIDGIKKDLKSNKDNMTEAALESVRQKLEGVRKSLKEAVDAILEAV